jgi:hypothetical protein
VCFLLLIFLPHGKFIRRWANADVPEKMAGLLEENARMLPRKSSSIVLVLEKLPARTELDVIAPLHRDMANLLETLESMFPTNEVEHYFNSLISKAIQPPIPTRSAKQMRSYVATCRSTRSWILRLLPNKRSSMMLVF